jgi:hypothetical protein
MIPGRMPSWISEIDAWLGRTLFVPIIIRVCQLTGQTQYAIARILWFAAGLYMLWYATSIPERVLAGVFCFVMMLSAGMRADHPKASMLFFRMFWWVGLITDILARLNGQDRGNIGTDILILFAEYAATIRTIPPRATKRRGSTAEAKA